MNEKGVYMDAEGFAAVKRTLLAEADRTLRETETSAVALLGGQKVVARLYERGKVGDWVSTGLVIETDLTKEEAVRLSEKWEPILKDAFDDGYGRLETAARELFVCLRQKLAYRQNPKTENS